ncbi:Panacea domain-containing protein [Salinarimonas sp.]|uniref:Panacea domain-containing protein n=1 Tax=Salinarimonas sp. TaxID=2766526 RepID=UPI0032D96829
MGVRLDSAAKYLCEKSGWSLSNLELQKLLYLAQVEHAFRNDGAPLVETAFQAWDYGPVVPALYRRLRMFGANPVRDVFRDARRIRAGSPSEISLRATWEQFGSVEPGELIEVSHWDKGAWAARYEPGVREIGITQRDIAAEARNRAVHADEWRRSAA